MAIWVLRKYTPPAHTGEKSARKKRGVAFIGVVATSGGKRVGDLCSMHFSRRGKGVKEQVTLLGIQRYTYLITATEAVVVACVVIAITARE